MAELTGCCSSNTKVDCNYLGSAMNLSDLDPASQYIKLKIIQKTVRVPASLYLHDLGALTVYEPPLKINANVNWNQMSDRAVRHVQPNLVAGGSSYHSSSTKRSITRCRPNAGCPGGAGVDIKHNSYDRYLNRLKGKSPLRREPIPQQLTMFWATGLPYIVGFPGTGPLNLTVAGGSLYVTNITGSGSISQISLADGSVTNLNWLVSIGGIPNFFTIIAYGNYLYGCAINDSNIYQNR